MTATARGLIAAGLEPDGRVAVMSRTRYDWTVLDFAIWAAGGQSVPVSATSSAEQVEWIVRDSNARFAIVEKIGRGASFDRADRVGVRFGQAYLNKFLGTGKGPGPGLYAAWALYDLLVHRRIRAEPGGRMRSPSAAAPRSTATSTCSSRPPGSSSTRGRA